MGYLDNFYKKLNKVLLDKMAIEREKARLENENMDLQRVLKQYLDGITVNDDVLSSENPLLVVNGRVNLNRRPVQRLPMRHNKPTVIEGNHMVSTNRIG